MNSKKSNWLFLSVILSHFVLVIVLIVGSSFFSFGMIENLLVSQMIIFVPALVSLMWGKEKATVHDLDFKKFKISTAFLIVVYTLLCMPLITVVNAVSMLFVDNTVAAISGEVLALPFPIMFLIMAVIGPFSEEFVFRGIIFKGYQKDGTLLGAVLLSALTFGFMHMNINQAGYAFVIGIALAFAKIATGSIWAPIIMHFFINAQSVCMMYLTEYISPGSMAQETENMTREMLMVVIGVYSVIAAITTVLAVCLLIYIANREGKISELKRLLIKPENVGKRITFPLLIALGICLIYMVLEAIAMKQIS